MPGLPNFPEKNGVCHSHQVPVPREVPQSAIECCLDLEVSDQIFITKFAVEYCSDPEEESYHSHGQLLSICHSTDVALRSKRLRLLVLEHISWHTC